MPLTELFRNKATDGQGLLVNCLLKKSATTITLGGYVGVVPHISHILKNRSKKNNL